jgi:membrane-associated PAP2 superfamily phosphatase
MAFVSDNKPARRPGSPPIVIPVLLLLGLSALMLLTDFDRVWAHRVWSVEGGWRLRDEPLVRLLYEYGNLPALIAGIGGMVLWPVLLWKQRPRQERALALFLGLSLILGPGIVVNAVFKDHYGRPRPNQTVEFGGTLPYHRLFEPGVGGVGKSFPSGHASMGFYWLGLFVWFWPIRRRTACAFGAAGLLHGGFMGWGRTVQGGHWASDVLWSAGCVYLSAWALWLVMTRFRSDASAGSPRKPRMNR